MIYQCMNCKRTVTVNELAICSDGKEYCDHCYCDAPEYASSDYEIIRREMPPGLFLDFKSNNIAEFILHEPTESNYTYQMALESGRMLSVFEAKHLFELGYITPSDGPFWINTPNASNTVYVFDGDINEVSITNVYPARFISQPHASTNTASKNDTKDNKPDYSLIPKVLMDQLAYCMMAGAAKYGRYNYTKGHNICQLTAAATRHIKQIEAGEDIDSDTSERVGVDVYHWANVAACCLMALHQAELDTLEDDRYKPGIT